MPAWKLLAHGSGGAGGIAGGRFLLARRDGPAKAYAEDVEEVIPVAADELQARVVVAAPADADFLDAVAVLLRQVQHLDVEHVPVNPLPGEQLSAHVAAEDLEAALRVGDVPQADQQVHAE